MAEPQPPRGEPARMSPETFTQQWGQIRQELRGWWDQLTERDLEQIGGQRDQLVRVLQERYRYTRERAQDEVDQRLQAYQTARSGMAETITTAAQEAAARLTETAETVRSQATEAASTAAAAVTETVRGVGVSLPDTALDQRIGDVVALVRRYPVASVLIGVGVGVLLARSLGKTRST
jgi:uncharacterized protein YjbJ (UPF0337 family)